MKRDTVNYFLVGVVVLVALSLLLVTLFTITGSRGASDRYHVYYGNVSGIRFGTPVFYEGYRIGEVATVHPERYSADDPELGAVQRTRYRVELRIERGWPIPQDSAAHLLSSGLLADVLIGIREGTDSRMLEPGSEIASREAADLFAAIQELAGEATNLTRNRLIPLVELLSERADSITGSLERDTPGLIEDVRGLLAQLSTSADGLTDLLGPANRSEVSALLGNLNLTSQQALRLAEDLNVSRAQIDTLLAELNGIASDARPALTEAAEDLRVTLASIAQRIDVIGHQLDSASRNFNEFSREIRQSPNRLLFSPQPDAVRNE